MPAITGQWNVNTERIPKLGGPRFDYEARGPICRAVSLRLAVTNTKSRSPWRRNNATYQQ
jgi:hypothetical protein